MALQDIQDSSPYSRNLILICISIILFIKADAQIMDDYIKLHVINIQFNNIDILEKFVFILFIWFNFRFWQIEKPKIKQIIIDDNLNTKYTNCYLSKKYIKKYKFPEFKNNNEINLFFNKSVWQVYLTNGTGRKDILGIVDNIYLLYIKLKFLIFDIRIISYRFPYILSLYTFLLYLDYMNKLPSNLKVIINSI